MLLGSPSTVQQFNIHANRPHRLDIKSMPFCRRQPFNVAVYVRAYRPVTRPTVKPNRSPRCVAGRSQPFVRSTHMPAISSTCRPTHMPTDRPTVESTRWHGFCSVSPLTGSIGQHTVQPTVQPWIKSVTRLMVAAIRSVVQRTLRPLARP